MYSKKFKAERSKYVRKPSRNVSKKVSSYRAVDERKKMYIYEKKFLDTTISGSVINTTGTIYSSFNIVPQDDTMSGRTGRAIQVTNINFRGSINAPEQLAGVSTVSGRTDEYCRLIWYIDTQTNGAAAAATDILAAATVDSFRNMPNVERFIILKDKVYNTCTSNDCFYDSTSDLLGQCARDWPIKFSKKVDVPITYDASASTGALTTIRSNNFGLLAISKTGTTTTRELNGVVRIKYYDLG